MATFKPLLGLGMTVVLLGTPGTRLGFLYRVGASAQPVEPGRVGRTGDIVRAEVVEVTAQKKLLRWSAPGLAHFAVFCLLAVAAFPVIRLRESPIKHGINLNRTNEALALSPDLDDASSSGAPPQP
jgi:hypothetical protein